MVEHAPRHRQGFAGATAVSGAIIGILAGSGAAALMAALMTPEALGAWGWRLPFMSGLLIGVAGVFLRRHIPDGALEREGAAPLLQVLRDHKLPVVKIGLTCLVNAVGFQIVFVYLVSWLQMVDGLPAAMALEINTANMVVFLLMIFAGGALTDRIGSLRVLFACALGLTLLSVPLFHLLARPDILTIGAAQMAFAVMIGLYVGAQPVLIVREAPAQVRCTALAIGYNVTLGVVGGLSPLVAASLIEGFHNPLAPGWMIAILSAGSLAALFAFRGGSPKAAEE